MFLDNKLMLSRPIVPQLISLVLSVLMIWQIYSGVVSISLLRQSMQPKHEQVTTTKIKEKKAPLTIGLNTPFFGEYALKTVNNATIKQSTLDLTVVGLMFSTGDTASHVIIRVAGHPEQPFGVGDILPGGAIIKRISSDGVLIEHNGILESLSLPNNALTFEPPIEPLGTSN